MSSKIGILVGLLMFVVGTVPTVIAGGFVPPAEGPVAFRRDKIPLDEENIAGLSHHLEVLARGLPADVATNRRGAAQMLALSLALNPGNTQARQLMTEYMENRHHAQVVGDQLDKSRARIWQLIGWLESADAGNQGRLLADCLKDVMAVSDPNHPKSQAQRTEGEKGAWNGWVPAPNAFQDASEVVKNDTPESTPESTPGPPDKEVPNKGGLEKAEVGVMLWKNSGNGEQPSWALAPAPLGMFVKTKDDKEEHDVDHFFVSIGANEEWKMFEKTNANIAQLLSKEHGKLPNLHVVITSKELGNSIASGRKQSVSAAAAVLASAAVTGMDPDAIILGQIDESGNYKVPSGFWKQIRSLGKGTGRKLVIPADAVPQMSALLAMENPAFFMEYEVLFASDFKQLLALSAKTPPETLAPAFVKFKEIRDRSTGQDIRQYIANRFIRQRLAEVQQIAPSHLSSKLLLLQAEGKRPTLIPRKVLAAELRTAIEPMGWISHKSEEDLSSSQISKLGATYDTCRSAVDGLDRYVEKADRPLIDQTRDLIVEIRSIERASRTRAEAKIVNEAIKSARGTLIRHNKELNNLLVTESGETPAP